MKPVLQLTDGRLRPLGGPDVPLLQGLLHDPAVRRFLCDDKLLPHETILDMQARSDRLDPQGLGLWIIEDASGTFAGIVGLEPASDEWASMLQAENKIEPIIAILPEFWGQGLASQALRGLIGHARDSLDLSSLVAAVDMPNARSHALIRRCGFVENGTVAGPANILQLYELRFVEAEPQG